MIEERLFNVLGPLVGGSVYPQVIPLENKTWPAISFSTISVDSNNTVSGESDEDLRVQINIYSRKLVEVLALRRLVFDAIRQEFEGSLRITDFDVYEPETKMFGRVLEFYI